MTYPIVLKTIFIPSYRTHAYILEDGSVLVQWMEGRMFTREQAMQIPYEGGVTKARYKEIMAERLQIHDELEQYAKTLVA